MSTLDVKTARGPRTVKMIRRAVRTLAYIERCEAKGQDVSRLADSKVKAIETLVRTRSCVRCGRAIENPESLRRWADDLLGSECRRQVNADAEECAADPTVERGFAHDLGFDDEQVVA